MQFRLQVAAHYMNYKVKTGHFLMQMEFLFSETSLWQHYQLNDVIYLVMLAISWTVPLYFDISKTQLSLSILYFDQMIMLAGFHAIFFYLEKAKRY